MRYIIRRHDAFSISLRLQLPPELLSRVCQWENDVTLRHLHHVCDSERAYETMQFTPAAVRDKIFDISQ